MRLLSVALALLVAAPLAAQHDDEAPPTEAPPGTSPTDTTAARWGLLAEGGIVWDVAADARLPHEDHIEMSGRHLSAIVRYGVDSTGALVLRRRVLWPTLRTTVAEDAPWWHAHRAYLTRTFEADVAPDVRLGGEAWAPGPLARVVLDGTLRLTHAPSRGVTLERTLFPSPDGWQLWERWTLRAEAAVEGLEVGVLRLDDEEDGVKGTYAITVASEAVPTRDLARGEAVTVDLAFGARLGAAPVPGDLRSAAEDAYAARRAYVEAVSERLVLRTTDPVLNEAFRMAKVRTAESLFETEMGLVHSPGGGSYYGGIWNNDQVEYAGPFFPYLGYAPAIEASLTAYRTFATTMGPDYAAIPSSFEMEGTLTCCGRDRGDASMYAYGASRFALATGDPEVAAELWPAVAWTLEYARRRTTAGGVIASETDEMEDRLPTGDANLSTTTLTYGGLRTAALLAAELGHEDSSIVYDARADALRDAIEEHFGATVEGYRTYRYFAGNDTLRHWINLPLTVGIHDRADETLAALTDVLWTTDGLDVHTDAGSFWDRGTLYALRGMFDAGATELGLDYLRRYAQRRLLGDHVPYPVEAYPEGGQAHLAAESALFGRVFVEGVFGIEPVGLRTFDLTPRLPASWPSMCLERVHAFGGPFDVCVSRAEAGLRVRVVQDGEAIYDRVTASGRTLTIELD